MGSSLLMESERRQGEKEGDIQQFQTAVQSLLSGRLLQESRHGHRNHAEDEIEVPLQRETCATARVADSLSTCSVELW